MLNVTIPKDMIASPEEILKNRALFSSLISLITEEESVLLTLTETFAKKYAPQKHREDFQKIHDNLSAELLTIDNSDIKILAKKLLEVAREAQDTDTIPTSEDFREMAIDSIRAVVMSVIKLIETTLAKSPSKPLRLNEDFLFVGVREDEAYDRIQKILLGHFECETALCFLVLKTLGKKIIERCCSTGEPYLFPLNITIEYRVDEKILVARRMMRE